MAKSARRKKLVKAKAEKRSAKLAAMGRGDTAGNVKSKYRERKAARMRGAPMAARKTAPWWSVLGAVMRPTVAPQPMFDEPTQSAA